jgi:hypothetical protein
MRNDGDDEYFSTYFSSHHFLFLSTTHDHISSRLLQLTLPGVHVESFLLSVQRKHVHQYIKKRTYVYMQVRRAKYKMTQ